MINQLRSELVKLRRPTAIAGYLGAAVAVSSLMTVVSVTNADNPNARGPGSSAGITLEGLAEPGGYLAGFEAASSFLGIIALALFASSVASEFSTGTIRALLVADSRRRPLLAGKIVGLTGFLTVSLSLGAIFAGLVSLLLSGPQGIDTGAWFSADGLTEGLSILANTVMAATVWGLFGSLLAMATRSAAISIAAGIGYFLIGEHLILQALWPSIADWLPAGLLAVLAEGGSATIGYGTALGLSALYGFAAYIISCKVFQRRDITD